MTRKFIQILRQSPAASNKSEKIVLTLSSKNPDKKKLNLNIEGSKIGKLPTVRTLLTPKNWVVKKKFARSQSPKLKKIDSLLVESNQLLSPVHEELDINFILGPFWQNDFEYNFQMIDKTFFDNYYNKESLLKDNEKAKNFNDME